MTSRAKVEDSGEWWDAWMLNHCALFGKSGSREWLIAMSGWKRPFLKSGYTEEELYDATDFLVMHPPEKGFVDNHLEAILTHLRSLRTIGADVDTGEQEKFPPCDLCNGTGVVIVPHRKCVVAGQWVRRQIVRNTAGQYYTCGVRCCCALGKWKSGREGDRPMLTVEEYDCWFPGWQAEMRRVDEEQRLDNLREGRGSKIIDQAIADLKRRAFEAGHYQYPEEEELNDEDGAANDRADPRGA